MFTLSSNWRLKGQFWNTDLSVSLEGEISGLEGLFVDTGELKGVPLSVSLELSKQLLSRDDLLDWGPLERLISERLCWKGGKFLGFQKANETTFQFWNTYKTKYL